MLLASWFREMCVGWLVSYPVWPAIWLHWDSADLPFTIETNNLRHILLCVVLRVRHQLYSGLQKGTETRSPFLGTPLSKFRDSSYVLVNNTCNLGRITKAITYSESLRSHDSFGIYIMCIRLSSQTLIFSIDLGAKSSKSGG